MSTVKRAKIILSIAILVLLTFLIITLKTQKFKKTEKPLTIAMLDIGQGDAIYIQTPSGNNMLIDSGRDRTILNELSSIIGFNKNTINSLQVSNPDLDHIGGFPFILNKYKVEQIISPGVNHDSLESFNQIEQIAKTKQIPILKPKQDSVLVIDNENNITFKILWPEGNSRNWEANAGSMIGLLTYGTHKILFTGDAPKEVEDQIIGKYKNELQNIDILKVGHHGSRTSTGENLIINTNPKYAIISSGLNNRYGHPHKEVIELLNKYKINTLNTAVDGRIICEVWINKETTCK